MIKLLLVDDEKGIADALKDFFEHRGFFAMTAGSGEDALELIRKDKPNIVFLDVAMKGMGGLETLKWIKKIDKSIRVIMLSGRSEQDVVERAKELGADEYITKPFRIDCLDQVIIKTVRELLQETSG